MRVQTRKKFALILTVVWMGLIFWFSAQPSKESGQMSMDVGRFIGKLVIHDYGSKSVKEQNEFAKKIEYGVRKTAHATEYAILGVFVWQVHMAYGKKEKRYLMSCIFIGAVYAVTDEFHQLFVPGRSGRITDVMIDTAGVTVGVLLSYGIYKVAKKRGRYLWNNVMPDGENN